MSSELVIVAASGLACETVEAVNAAGQYKVIGVVDDDGARHGASVVGVPILGGLAELAQHPQADIVVCVGKGAARESIVGRLTAMGIEASRYATVIHPSVLVPASCVIGPGSVVLAGCVITADVRIGRHVVLMPNVTLTHDDKVEDFVTICAGVTIGGCVSVGERSFLGMSASVREQRLIGVDAILGMGAVLVDDLPDGQTWVGIPARRQRRAS